MAENQEKIRINEKVGKVYKSNFHHTRCLSHNCLYFVVQILSHMSENVSDHVLKKTLELKIFRHFPGMIISRAL